MMVMRRSLSPEIRELSVMPSASRRLVQAPVGAGGVLLPLLPVLVMVFLLLLFIPVVGAQAAAAPAAAGAETAELMATLTTVVNKVEVQRQGKGSWVEAVAPMPLYLGDRVRTQRGAKAAILFQDGSEVFLNQDTMLEIVKVLDPSKRTGVVTRLRLFLGDIFSRVNPQKTTLEFESPDAVATIRGTEFSLRTIATTLFSVDRIPPYNFDTWKRMYSFRSTLAVLKGLVNWFNSLGSMLVGAGQISEATRNTAPTSPVTFSPDELGLTWAEEFEKEMQKEEADQGDDAEAPRENGGPEGAEPDGGGPESGGTESTAPESLTPPPSGTTPDQTKPEPQPADGISGSQADEPTAIPLLPVTTEKKPAADSKAESEKKDSGQAAEIAGIKVPIYTAKDLERLIAPGAFALLDEARGLVEIKKKTAEEWEGAAWPLAIYEGDCLRIRDRSGARLILSDGSVLLINEETMLDLSKRVEVAHPNGFVIEARIYTGEVYVDIHSLVAYTEVLTPNGLISTLDGAYLVQVETAQRQTSMSTAGEAIFAAFGFTDIYTTRLTVLQGQAFFVNRWGTRQVERLKQSESRGSGAPGRPEDVDPAKLSLTWVRNLARH